MSEPRYESIVRELRAASPPAPEELRERVRALREPQTKRVWRLRPALVAAAAIAVTVAVGAAAIGGLTRSTSAKHGASNGEASRALAAGPAAGTVSGSGHQGSLGQASSPKVVTKAPEYKADFNDQLLLAPDLTPGSRLKQYGVSMSLRVRDLSRSTQTAVRQTRRLGGYVAAANFATGSNTGDSSLDLRVPVQHVQQAIARFNDLGTILSQRISVLDLQAPLDRTEARIAAQRKLIAQLEGLSTLTPEQQLQLQDAKRAVRRLSQSRTSLVREGAYAKISLQLTTRKAAAKNVAPGRFDRFWGDAGDILGKEAIAVLYALVVAGPFAILAALALVAERSRRRRADHRLLEETG
ncbi:MAG TPA: DUF4349 domain-containing protein [Gaiellaceae bacterium]|nr:DUF4349 domain-containing protein [Gaiellaceae bacterium]